MYDEIEVQKGLYTLTEGRGAPAGTIIFREKSPELKDNIYAGKVGAGFDENSSTKTGFTQVDLGNEKYTARLKYSQKEGLDFKDGDNKLVESSFSNKASGLNLYWNPTSSLSTEMKYETNLTEDAKYSALQMDAPKAELTSYDIKVVKTSEGFFNKFDFSLYQSNIEHIMKNDERDAVMDMEVESSSDTTGGRFLGIFSKNSILGKVGLDFQNTSQLAEKYHNDVLNTYMWPDADINQTGLFAEIEHDFGLKYGLRIDSITAKANMMAGSASSAYEMVYGTAYEEVNETNLSALIRYTKEYSKSIKSFISLSRTVRTADVNERKISSKTEKQSQNNELGSQTAFAKYLKHVRDRVSQMKTYPFIAKRLKQEGTVTISLTIQSSGKILKSEIIQKCPHQSLNNATSKLISSFGPFKEFPMKIKYTQVTVNIPIIYELI